MSLFSYSSWDPNQCLEVNSGQGLVRAFPVSNALHLYFFIFCLKKILINTWGPKAVASLVYILELVLHICTYTRLHSLLCVAFLANDSNSNYVIGRWSAYDMRSGTLIVFILCVAIFTFVAFAFNSY